MRRKIAYEKFRENLVCNHFSLFSVLNIFKFNLMIKTISLNRTKKIVKNSRSFIFIKWKLLRSSVLVIVFI